MIYLLDTDTCIAHLRSTDPLVSQRIVDRLPNDVLLCSVVKGELVYGALHSRRPNENMRRTREFFALFKSLPFDDDAAHEYGQIRSSLAAKGTPIGSNDLQIAAIAKVHDLALVTHNVGEFSRVPGLRFEDWTEAQDSS